MVTNVIFIASAVINPAEPATAGYKWRLLHRYTQSSTDCSLRQSEAMIQFTDVLGSPRCHSWHKMKVMWLHSCHRGNGEISGAAKIYTGLWCDPENIYYKGWRRRSEKIDFDTASWMEKEKQKYSFVSMLCPSLDLSGPGSLPPVKTQVYVMSLRRNLRLLKRS